MSFFVRACVTALHEIPAVNAEISGDEIIYKNYVNMGIAVGTEKGLVVPVLRDVQDMGLAKLSRQLAISGARPATASWQSKICRAAHLPCPMAGFTAPSCRHRY